MRIWMLLHAIFIFFSSVMAYLLIPVASIVLFLAGFFLMFVAVCLIYRVDMWRAVFFSLIPVLFVSATILALVGTVSLVSIAIGLLEFFYVLQVFFWSFALVPFIARQYYVYGRRYDNVVLVFLVSVFAALLSLFVGIMLVYASIYLVFCVVLAYVFEREYASSHSSR